MSHERPLWHYAACLVIVLSIGQVYSNSLRAPFVFDDVESIAENPTIRSLSNWREIISPPDDGETVGGRPVVNLSFALNYAWTETRVWSYHFVNLIIHIIAAVLLFGIARLALAEPAVPEALRKQSVLCAFGIALCWGVHPLITESVSYIVQRAESLAGLSSLAVLYCAIRASAGQNRWAWQSAAVIASLLGMATKETMVVVPLLVVFYDWAFQKSSLSATLKRRPLFYGALAATWILLGVLVVQSPSRGGSAGFGQGISVWEYARTQFGFIVTYLKLSFWPDNLVFDYGDTIVHSPGEIYPPLAFVAVLAAATLWGWSKMRFRPFAFLGVWFFCWLAPSSSVVPVLTQTGAEHRMYLPLVAVVAAVVVLLALLWHQIARRMPIAVQALVPVSTVIAVALALGIVSHRRNVDYQSNYALWNDTVAKRPQNWRALSNLAWIQFLQGDPETAVETYNRSIAAKSRFPIPFQGRGDVFMKLGRFAEAENDYRKVIELDPLRISAHFKLGACLIQQEKFEEALSPLNETIRLAPQGADGYRLRGNALSQLRRYAEAVKDFSTALRLDPKLDVVYFHRGRCLYVQKRTREAVADFSKAIELNSKQAAYFLNRGIALGDLDQNEAAAQDCSMALQLKPTLVAAYQARAATNLKLKKYELVRADFEQLQQLGKSPEPALVEKLQQAEDARSE